MAEDEMIVALVERALEVAIELAAEPIGHRQGARGALGLRRAQAPARVVAPHADHRRRPVHVAPAQGHQLALAQAGHRRREIEGVIGERANVGL
jgi:hypothetical protein